MKFEVFGKQGCAKCRSTQEKLAHLVSKSDAGPAAAILFVDLDTVEGLAEAAFQDVQEVPTTILRSEAGEPMARWDARIPPAAEIQAFLAGGRA